LLKGIFVFLILAVSAVAGPRDAQWAQVEEAVQKGLPKTAIRQLEPIVAGALADKSYAEATKAIARKIALEGSIQGEKAEEKIVRFEAELKMTPAAMKPAMEVILAHWYWQYFEQNRGRFLQRTAVTSGSGSDIQTWDLGRILAEVDHHFTAALADEATLKATLIGDYDDLLTKGSVPDSYRPTLFDFFAAEALKFYQAGEHAQTVDDDEFEVRADSPIFSDVREFINWQPASNNNTSPELNAIRLYQTLLKFHENDANRDAFFDADLARITYGNNIATGDDKPIRYQSALEHLAETAAGHEISAQSLAALAELLFQDKQPAQAHAVALRGRTAFPDSVGGLQCANLIQRIEAKSAQLRTEQVWNAPWPIRTPANTASSRINHLR